MVVLAKPDGDDPRGERPRKGSQRRLLDRAQAGGEKHVAVVLELADGQDRVDPLVLLQRQQVDDGPAPGARTRLGNPVDLEPVDLSAARETQQRVVGIGDEQLVDEILFLDAGRRPAPPAPALCLVRRQRLRLGIAAVGKRHHQLFLGNQVLDGQVRVVLDDLRTAFVRVSVPDLGQLLAHHRKQAVRVGQNLN